MDRTDRQSVFDFVVRFLRRQGRPSTSGEGSDDCMYRGRDGCRCAAGCLIPDDLYTPEMEGKAAADDQLPGEALASLGHDLQFVLALQAMHDNLASHWTPESLATGYSEIARAWGLDPAATQAA